MKESYRSIVFCFKFICSIPCFLTEGLENTWVCLNRNNTRFPFLNDFDTAHRPLKTYYACVGQTRRSSFFCLFCFLPSELLAAQVTTQWLTKEEKNGNVYSAWPPSFIANLGESDSRLAGCPHQRRIVLRVVTSK